MSPWLSSAFGGMKTVFVVQHVRVLPDGQDDTKCIGVYRSLDSALAAVERLRLQPGFSDHAKLCDPMTDDSDDGFHVDEYELDKDHWTEGFVSV
jgi:hypothetical protein